MTVLDAANPLHAVPTLLQPEAGPGGEESLDTECGSFSMMELPDEAWSDERLLEHFEDVRWLVETGADPVFVVPNAERTLDLLAARGMAVALDLPRRLP